MTSETDKKARKPREASGMAKLYLIAYNLAQVVGWSYMLWQLVAFYTIHKGTTETLWEYIGWTVIVFQNLAILEIINVALGLVRSGLFITIMQVFSRVMVVCGVIMATPDAKISPGVPLALFAWSITEIIRYGYYAANLMGHIPYLLVYLRYTTFIVLYPTGVTGELLCFYWAQDYVKREKLWSIEMPNSYNATFSYYYFLWAIMLSYLYGFPLLYKHMFSQRKKVLGSRSH